MQNVKVASNLVKNYINSESIYHWQNIRNFGPIFEQNASINFEPIFEKSVNFGPIFEKDV